MSVSVRATCSVSLLVYLPFPHRHLPYHGALLHGTCARYKGGKVAKPAPNIISPQ